MTLASSNLDWLYHLLGYTLAAAGLLLLLWSLFWDRSRGRRRCPKCWYDMSGLPGLKCPECGRVARSEQHVRRTRRHRRRLVGGVLSLMAAATVLGSTTSLTFWLRQIPGWVLVRVAPEQELQAKSGSPATFSSLIGGSTGSWLMQEVEGRAATTGIFTPDQWRVLFERSQVVRPSRSPWPRDQPLYVDVVLPDWLRDAEAAFEPRLEHAGAPTAGSLTWVTFGATIPSFIDPRFQLAGAMGPGESSATFDATLSLSRFAMRPAAWRID